MQFTENTWMAYFTQLGPAFQMLWLCEMFQVMIHWPMKGTLQVQTELTWDFNWPGAVLQFIVEFNSKITMCLYILHNFVLK